MVDYQSIKINKETLTDLSKLKREMRASSKHQVIKILIECYYQQRKQFEIPFHFQSLMDKIMERLPLELKKNVYRGMAKELVKKSKELKIE